MAARAVWATILIEARREWGFRKLGSDKVFEMGLPMLSGMKLILSCLALCLGSCAVSTSGAPHGLRRAVMRHAEVPAAGEIVSEVGFEADPGERKQVPLLLEYGIGDGGALFLDVSAYEKNNAATGDGESIGDIALGVRQQFWGNDYGRLGAFEGRVSFPTGDEDDGVGTGSVDWYASALLSQSYESVRLTGWLEIGVLGDAFDSGTDTQRTAAISAATNLGDTLIGFLECQSVFREDVDPSTARFGLAWETGGGSSMDFGLVAGLNDDAPDAAFFLGFHKSLGFFSRTGPSLSLAE